MNGSFDVNGYRMELGPNGEPRFISLAAPGCGNGDWDSQFNLATGTNGIVLAMTVVDNAIYVGGLFTSVGNIAANRVAKFDTTTNTWSALSQGNGNGVDNSVYSLAVIGNNLFVGGSFFSANVGGTGGTPQITARNVAKFDTTTNTWSTLSQGNGNGVGGGFAALALAAIGNNLFVGGQFTTANVGGTGGTPQITVNNVAKFDTTTNTWSALSQGDGNGVGSTAYALAAIGNNLFVGGAFTTANQGGTGGTPQITANSVAKFDTAANTWSALSQGNGNGLGAGGAAFALAAIGNNLFVGGSFNTVNSGGTGGTPAITAFGVARFDTTANIWSAVSQGNGFGVNGTVLGLSVTGNSLLVGGQFTTANAFGTSQVTANNMAKFDTSTNTWSAFIQGNGNGTNDIVRALSAVGNNLFIGGDFATVNAGGTGGTPAITVSRVGRFDLSTNVWSALAPGVGNGINGNMSALAVIGNAIYVGGNFNVVGNVAANRVAKFDTTTNTWSALSQGNGNGVGGQVVALAVMGNNLYVGGGFFTANVGGTGGTPEITARNVAKFDTTTNTWSALSQGNGNGVNSSVFALAVIGNNVFVGGYSTTVNVGGTGGTPQITANRVAKFDTTTNTWSALSQGDGNGVGGFQVTAFAVMGNSLFVSGDFTTVNQGGTGGTPQIAANYVARFDTATNTWSALSQGNGNGIGAGGSVFALAVMGSDLFVGGFFNSVNQGGTGGTPQVAANYVAKFNTANNTWSALSQGNGNGVNSSVTSLTVTGSNLYVGGGFTSANAGGTGGTPQIAANRVAKYNTLINAWGNLPGSGGGNGIDGPVYGLGAKDCDLYAVGFFTFADNKLSVNIARYIAGPNTEPTITPLAQTVQAGSTVQIADTNDVEDAENTLRIQISSDGMTFGNTATVNGITVTLNDSNTSSPGINPNSVGQVFATVTAVCCTSNANFTLQVKDSSDVAVTAVLQLTVVFTPEIAVSDTSSGGGIADGGSFNFGATTLGTPLTKTFTVTNSGSGDLTLSNLTVPSGFSIAANFGNTTVTPGNSTTFQITMAAGAAGSPSGSLSFDNNDADENPFNFTISGTVSTSAISALQVYDGFAYPNGDFNGQNGGSGFAGAWSNAGNTIVSTSLTPVAPSDNLKTCCGSVSVAGNHQGAFRSLASTYGNATETVYISFVGVSNSGDYAGVSLFNGNNEIVFMGRASSGVTKWTLDRSATGNFGISNVNTTVTSLLVLRIDFNAGTTLGNERLRLYVNPALGVEPGVADVDLTNAANFTFNRIRIQAGPNTTGTSFDEFRLGSTFADVTPPAAPEIAVSETGVGDIADGGSFSFGTTPFGAPVTKTFTVTNLCNANLTLANLTVPAGFSIAADFGSTTVTPGNSTTFQITMSADAVGTPSGSLSFDNNDADENPFNFTISGTVTGTAPMISCPTGITTNTDPGQCTASVTFSATATGAPTPTVMCSPASGFAFPKGVTTVTCTASNGVAPDATCMFTVTVNDTQAPTLGACPTNITNQSAGANCMATVNFTPPTATDNCGTPMVICTPASGASFPLGTTTVSCVAKDTANNMSAACTFTVQVVDSTAPTLSACPTNITNQAAGANCMAVVNFTPPTATDNCGSATVTCTPASGASFPLGTTTVSCVAKDAANNMSAPCTFMVQVVDTTAPTLGACPANVVNQSAGANCMAVVSFTPPTATDNCSTATVTCTPASGASFSLGTTTVSCTAKDAANNMSAPCTFMVQVVDTTAPTLGACPTNITQPPTAGACGAVVTFTNPTATDNCGAATVTCSPASGANFPIGTTTVSCKATDAANNMSSPCTFTVTVTASAPPVLTYSSPQMAVPGQSQMINPATGPSDDGTVASIVVQSVTPSTAPGTITVNSLGVVTVPNNIPAGSYNVTIRATDNCGAFTDASFTLNVSCVAITVTPQSLPNGFVGTPYTQALGAMGGTPSYAFTLDSGAFPPGLSIVGSNLMGTPTATGVFNFTIKATDSGGCFGTRAHTVVISGTGLQFYPLAHPIRLVDTRVGASACQTPGMPVDPGNALTVPARGVCGGLTIPANAAAVTGNVTTVGPAANGFLTIYSSSAAQPQASNSNYQLGQTLNNVFTVGLGAADGAFKIFSAQKTDVIVDITGYFAPPGTGGLFFHPLPAPVRLLDTRAGQTACTMPGTPIPADTEVLQQGNAICGIPASAVALVGNAITVGPAAQGFLTLFPANESRPLIASGNYQAGQTLNSPFTVGLSPSGNFTIYSLRQTDLVVDVLGYYSADATDTIGIGLLFSPMTPARLLDTRPMQPACFTLGVPLPATTEIAQGARSTCSIPTTAQAIVGNATTVTPAAQGFLTFWPSDATRPNAVTSNFAAGVNFNRHFTVGLGADGAFKLYALTSTHLVVDVSGSFVP